MAKGIVAGLLVAIGAVAFIVSRGPSISPARQERAKRTGLIKEVSPAAAPTNVVTRPKHDPNARPTRPGEQLNGYVMTPAGMVCKIPTNKVERVKPYYAIFDHMNENFISSILTMRPGDTVIGDIHFNGRFTKDFLESLKDPIIVKNDDTDEVKEIKRAVNEAKIELKAAYDRGEDIEAIVLKEREEFRQLANYKQQLRKEVLDYANREAVSEDDVDDYLAAANKMLEARGISPIKATPFKRIKLKMKEGWEDRK